MTTLNDPADTEGQLIAASKVNGTNVYNLAGEHLGSIYDVMLNKQSGQSEYAILSFGGFLGIGEKYHPLPWHILKYDPLQEGYVVDLDRDRLEGAPVYEGRDEAAWDDRGWGHRVDDYYGAPGHDDISGGMIAADPVLGLPPTHRGVCCRCAAGSAA
jgi:sporulation protein YlmC with PRC-barrel domain